MAKDGLLIVISMLIPGGINAIVAYRRILWNCRTLRKFSPFKSRVFWECIIVEWVIPCLLFYCYEFYTQPPTFSQKLVIEAGIAGIIIAALFHSELETLIEPKEKIPNIEVLKVLLGVLKLHDKCYWRSVLKRIRQESRQPLREFWLDLLKELSSSSYLDDGLLWLSMDINQRIELSEPEREKLRNLCDSLHQQQDINNKIAGIEYLLNWYYDEELGQALKKFGVSELLLQKYAHIID